MSYFLFFIGYSLPILRLIIFFSCLSRLKAIFPIYSKLIVIISICVCISPIELIQEYGTKISQNSTFENLILCANEILKGIILAIPFILILESIVMITTGIDSLRGAQAGNQWFQSHTQNSGTQKQLEYLGILWLCICVLHSGAYKIIIEIFYSSFTKLNLEDYLTLSFKQQINLEQVIFFIVKLCSKIIMLSVLICSPQILLSLTVDIISLGTAKILKPQSLIYEFTSIKMLCGALLSMWVFSQFFRSHFLENYLNIIKDSLSITHVLITAF